MTKGNITQEIGLIPDTIAADESLVESLNLRNQLISRTDVLSKVKRLFTIPGLDMMTTRQVAEFYEVDDPHIRQVYKRNKGEIDGDGVSVQKSNEFSPLHCVTDKNLRGKRSIDFGEFQIDLPYNGTINLFSPRAVLRIGMLLRDSEVAKEVRTQLLNTMEHATQEQKTAEIDTEQEILNLAIKGYQENNMSTVLSAMSKLADYNDRYKQQVRELEVANNDLEVENTVLAKKKLVSDPRTIINILIRSYGALRLHGRYGQAWNEFYRRLNDQLEIRVKTRAAYRKIDNALDTIRDDEWEDCVEVAFALVREAGLDGAKLVREYNAEEYAGLMA